MKKTLSLLLLLSLVLSLASCGQKTTTDDPVAAACNGLREMSVFISEDKRKAIHLP